MKLLSNVQAARKLGISSMSLGRYIKSGKIAAPKMLQAGNKTLHGWTEEDIEHVRQLLPKIANGRKTRYKQSAKTKAPAKVPVPHKKRRPKKK
jgi:predicted DNA-binding transcriptional regulator AlpA